MFIYAGLVQYTFTALLNLKELNRVGTKQFLESFGAELTDYLAESQTCPQTY